MKLTDPFKIYDFVNWFWVRHENLLVWENIFCLNMVGLKRSNKKEKDNCYVIKCKEIQKALIFTPLFQ